MNSSKRCVCSFCALLCALLSLVRANQVLGPSPPVVYVPVNVTATFTCTYEDFNIITDAWFWKVGDMKFSNLDHTDVVSGGSISTLRANVSQHSQQPTLVTCELFRRQGKTFHFLANSTNVSQILTYGTNQYKDFCHCLRARVDPVSLSRRTLLARKPVRVGE